LKINEKLYIAFGIILSFSLIIGIVGLVTFGSANEEMDFLEQHSTPNVLRALEMRTAVFQVQQWLTDASATGWEDGFDEAASWAEVYYENSDALKKDLEEIGELDNLAEVEAADESFDAYYEFGQLMARAYIDEGQEEGNEYMLQFDGYAADIGEKMEIIHQDMISDQENTFNLINTYKRNFSNVVWVSLILSLIFGVTISLYIARLITEPLISLESASKQLAQGDLRIKIDNKILNEKDEIGSLARSFNIMVENFKQMIRNVIANSNTMASTAEELSASSEETNASTEQVSATVQEIAKGGQVLSSNANDSKQATEGLITSVNMVATSAQNSSQKAVEAKDVAMKGGESAKLAGEKMKVISDSVASSALNMQELGTKTEEINKIIEVINSISEQTNLLALNAAIEAARAGEAGKGFAVVADEVRKLAEESQKATKQIEEMVGDIINSTKTNVENMQKSTKDVAEGSEIVNEALNSLTQIGTKIAEVASDFEMITAATQGQLDSSEKVKKSIQEVSSVAEESAASTEEVSASVEEITGSVQQVSNSAQSLAKGAEELKQLVNQFKVDEV